jgi:orotidine-5'-phosphate decarboxylase
MAIEFGDRVRERIQERGPLCVGIDPSAAHLRSWGRDDDATGLEFAALALLEAAIEVAAAVKVQVAFFERFGSAGYAVLERLLTEARDGDLLCIADAKRGDVGSTNDAYADSWLSPSSPLAADAMTVHPYLGVGAMGRFVELARTHGKGLYIVVASSNPEGRVIQTSRTDTDESVEDRLLRTVAELNAGSAGLGPFGAVVGATRDRPQFTLRDTRGTFVVPGVGAQGATADDVARLFHDAEPHSVLASVSRAVADAGPTRRALVDTMQRWRDDLVSALA